MFDIVNLSGGAARRRAAPARGSATNYKSVAMTKKPIKPDQLEDRIPHPSDDVTNPSDARESLKRGSVGPVGRYLRIEVSSLLRALAEPQRQRRARDELPGYDPDYEFEFNTPDVLWAIQNGREELVGQNPVELAKLFTVLGDMLDPSGNSEFKLKPRRRRRGMPKNRALADRDGAVVQDLKFSLARHGKLEAAVSEVGPKHKRGRSTLFRAWPSRNGGSNKCGKKRDRIQHARGPETEVAEPEQTKTDSGLK